MDRQCLWTWELHRLQHLGTFQQGNDYGRRRELHALEVLLPSNANFKCGGGMWVPQVSSSHANSLSWFGIGASSCFLLHKKKREKKMRGVAMVTMLNSSSPNHRGKYSQCPTFDIKHSPAGRSPEDHQVRTHVCPCLNKVQSCFMLPLSVVVCSSLNVCRETHS